MDFDVFIGEQLVGNLAHDAHTNRFSWSYSAGWQTLANRFALSPQLPIEENTAISIDQHSAVVRQFFENLLPEGQQLDDAARIYKVSKSSITGLLSAFGKETTGALRIVPKGFGDGRERPEKRLLLREEISRRIREREFVPFSIWDGKIHLSIAGVQDKIAVLKEGDDWFLPNGRDLASTHILKPEPTHAKFSGLTTNEFFCMRLARAVRIPVADVELTFVPEPLLVITRFDRKARAGADKVDRLHVVDGCQALGLSSAMKYERNFGEGEHVRHLRDGASPPKFFELLNTGPRPAAQRVAFLAWTIFQTLIGNCDAHAKNISFFCDSDGLRLAPAYDLICTIPFDDLSKTLAMAIGDAFELSDLTPLEWAYFAKTCGLSQRLVAGEVARLGNLILLRLPAIAEDTLRAGGTPEMVHKMCAFITAQCRDQVARAPLIAQVNRSLL